MEAFLNVQDKAAGKKRQNEDKNLGQFDMAEEMDVLMRSYESENLEKRNWALQGEVVADERRKDELLEQFVDVDYRARTAPTITEEKTAHLEAIIRKRVKEKLFDDVVRKLRENEALVPVYRNQTAIEQIVRKSLSEVYEDKFNDELNREERGAGQPKAQLDPRVKEIQQNMDSLFLKLNALSHFQFRPQPIREEVKIVSNMPSLHMEEVGPLAAVEADMNLLAPEEAMRRAKSAPKGEEERTETDRKRERRRKKKKQRVLASIGAMEKGEGRKRGRGEGRRKKLDFSGEMQALTRSEAGEGARKRRRKQTEAGRGQLT